MCKRCNYLGVTIYQHLRWDLHIKKVTVKIRSLLCRFRYLSGILRLPELTILYQSLIESQLAYGIVAPFSKLQCVAEVDIEDNIDQNRMYSRNKTIIPYAEHTYHTRCKEIITHKVRTSKQIGQRHYSYVIRRLHDMIPQALKNEKRLGPFKKLVGKWIHGVSGVTVLQLSK
ncbi:hypothetical protein WA026_019633 [Henosepilachna vigintioctopunctata]|uniref:Uncharacterized protein n=1 Tax=Henosepilachna vigintioctopunctata TaxID=420089 RepID=A0AAW1TMX8_9CUCU